MQIKRQITTFFANREVRLFGRGLRQLSDLLVDGPEQALAILALHLDADGVRTS